MAAHAYWKVGTGFDHQSAAMLYKILMPLQQKKAPFSDILSGSYKNTVWVKPETLCEMKFSAWTSTGKVRHASYQGLREDMPHVMHYAAPASKRHVPTNCLH